MSVIVDEKTWALIAEKLNDIRDVVNTSTYTPNDGALSQCFDKIETLSAEATLAMLKVIGPAPESGMGLQKVARALFDAGQWASIANWESFWATPQLRAMAERLACAAILAIREPTKKMIEAGNDEVANRMDGFTDSGGSYDYLPSGSSYFIFQSMIDALLAEGGK